MPDRHGLAPSVIWDTAVDAAAHGLAVVVTVAATTGDQLPAVPAVIGARVPGVPVVITRLPEPPETASDSESETAPPDLEPEPAPPDDSSEKPEQSDSTERRP